MAASQCGHRGNVIPVFVAFNNDGEIALHINLFVSRYREPSLLLKEELDPRFRGDDRLS